MIGADTAIARLVRANAKLHFGCSQRAFWLLSVLTAPSRLDDTSREGLHSQRHGREMRSLARLVAQRPVCYCCYCDPVKGKPSGVRRFRRSLSPKREDGWWPRRQEAGE